jgi:hypothetical protein
VELFYLLFKLTQLTEGLQRTIAYFETLLREHGKSVAAR